MTKSTEIPKRLHLCSDCHRNSLCLHQPIEDEINRILEDEDIKQSYYDWLDKQTEDLDEREIAAQKQGIEDFIKNHENYEWYYGE